ncbi:PREDICTED: protein KINESIN LIGHT CHAIN-RELATED 2-like isoform X2 [Ipomoea nil]|uniref:protein KINESIN LIGHT CHAIN-RELATED 2-like isoform X2 n=1 Tax=Ipomoea nil TaxID=35883 RepID=UPI000901FCAB|nr:PREDICTED: protein KINESIN LIGHT CHAIN-RELATED 2-like isoform X2 [Ipomoea nil]
MDPIVMEGWIGGNVNREESDGQFVGAAYKEMFSESSPRSPLYTHSPAETDSFDLAMDGAMDTSIEQLYNNVYEMQSSDHSPSRRSFLSYGEESRIDSELRYLAGVDYGEVEEIKKEVVVEDTGVGIVSDREKGKCEDEKFGKMNNNNNKLNSPVKVTRKPNPRTSKCSHGRTPFTRKMSSSSTNLRKLNTPQSLRKGGEDGGKGGKPTYLGSYLLKQARALVSSGENDQKALDLTLRAIKSFEVSSKPNSSNLEFVMCLHVAAALYCRLGRYREAIPVLERSIEIPAMDKGQNHALAKFAGCMQLGDTYAMQGQIENSILFYTAGLEIQRQVLGEKDSRLGETCRYVAEAHIQAMQFDEAERLCQMALEIHRENARPASFEEAADRRLLGLVYDSKGDYEAALEHYVLASMALAAQGQEAEVAAIDCNIGDAYLALARYDEAICSYQKALTTFKTIKGESHPSVASVFVRLADLYYRIGKFKDSKSYCENALRVYAKPAPAPATLPKTQPEEIASGLVDVSAIYESMDEPEQALNLLHKAIKAYGDAPGQQSTIAGIEAQIGVLYYILGDYSDSYTSLKTAIDKFRAIGEKKSALLGIALNQMGLTCVQLYAINEAADLFEEARSILETEYGPYHADTLGVYSNLAGTYDAMGRTADAIEILEFVVGMREDKLGTANPDVDDEKRRLEELLKEAGRVRNKKAKSLEALLGKKTHPLRNWELNVLQSV